MREPDGVEQLVSKIGALKSARGEERWALTLFPGRLHVARNVHGCIELFLEGARGSFAQGAIGRGLDHGMYRDLSGRQFPALVVRSASGQEWERPMAHLAYEALQAISQDKAITNEDLLAMIGPYLNLVIETDLLSIEQQVGLTAELLFLESLLTEAARNGISSRRVLRCWTGWDSATRDFKSGDVAVEVKATGKAARQHWVHPMYQLLPEPGSAEKVYIYSVGLRVDRSRDFRLSNVIERVFESLPDDMHATFVQHLGDYGGCGYNVADRHQYELEPGLLATFPPGLYRVDTLQDIMRPDVYVAGRLPNRVIDVRYLVDLEGLQPIGQAQREALLLQMLKHRGD